MNLGKRLANGFASDDAAAEAAEEALTGVVPEPPMRATSSGYVEAHSTTVPAPPLPAVTP